MSWIKIALSLVAGLLILSVLVVGGFFYIANKSSKNKSDKIDELGKIPLGSSVEDVIKLAVKQGIDFESKEFAIPEVIEFVDENSGKNGIGEKVHRNTDLSKFKNGKLNIGLSLFLFSRKGCEYTITDGKVSNIRIWWLD